MNKTIQISQRLKLRGSRCQARPPAAGSPPPRPLTSSLFWTVFVLGLAGPLLGQQNQDLPFTSASTGADGPLRMRWAPNPSHQNAMAYDAARQKMILFGGYRSSPSQNLNETYAWDGTNWLGVSPFTSPSPPRYSPTLVYDAARQRTIMFGGYNGGVYGDIWSWDGTNWANLNPPNLPLPRYLHAMAYDAARQQILLFGGFYNRMLNDTWIWNGTNWISLTPKNSPRQRYGHSMAYDAARQQVVMIGGYDANGNVYLNDTWTWDGTNWMAMNPATTPSPTYGGAMTYDEARRQTIFFGAYSTNTWAWDGTNWTLLTPQTSPTLRGWNSLAYDPVHQNIVLFGGESNGSLGDSWLWDGTNWSYYGSSVVAYDVTARGNGIWNYTTIDIDGGVSVTFKKNSANMPVRWLATGKVNINGSLILDGADGGNNPSPGQEAPGGPGAFAGGLGGVRFDQSGSYAGTPGQGPGGGLPGVTSAQGGADGTYAGTYGNSYLQPLIGGSGGGGTASASSVNGANGGGGGGAIYISSSRDIIVNGKISTKGGNRGVSFVGGVGYVYAGFGSGGAIRLQADRISGNGTLDASGLNNNPGYIRLEAYYRNLAGATTPVSVNSAPVVGQSIDTTAGLVVTSVGGVAVRLPSRGDTTDPDVIFTNAGPVTVTVTSTNIPNLTPVQLRVTANGQIITTNSTLAGGTASFTVTVPKGVGTIQASATFTLSN